MIDLDAMNKDPWPTWPVDKKDLRGLVDEIERLRAALREIEAMKWFARPCEIAHAALEGEKTDD